MVSDLHSNYIKKILVCFIAPVLLSYVNSALAEYAITGREMMGMPDICKKLTPGNYELSARRMMTGNAGQLKSMGLAHVQHYCHGLKSVMRRSYETAIKEFTYVQKHSNKRNPLLPSTSYELGKIYLKTGNDGNAITEFQNAIKLKQNYIPAYWALGEYYRKKGDAEKANSFYREGLKYSPESKALKRGLKKLNASAATGKKNDAKPEEPEENKTK